MRIIDEDAMLAQLKTVDYEAEHSAVLISDMSKIMREWVKRQPTFTAPEIVYCQDCAHHWDLNGKHICVKLNCECPGDSEFFCKFGSKKDGKID